MNRIPLRGRRQIIAASEEPDGRSLRAETRARLVQGIANARLWLDELVTGEMPDIKAIALREACSERQVRLTLNLAFLAPTIVKAAVEGTLPEGHGVVQCTTMPIVWGR